ncbi:hypothetical protein [Rugosimonospora africana]|uniref:CDP-diglyceride synthetase n=1 Tax=Rugosimonospora africana TaxID=556532 RepID=A0A8J3QMS4_9ACTN|nr:hypothetical protein [Rugosimonospora africana]GIH12352.1 hypothetical protein Raf01_05240 [Rugosimonospora africana]
MSPTIPPGGGREAADGGRDDWRGQRADARRSPRADSPERRIDDSDPFGWSAARDGGIDYPSGPPEEQQRGGRADRARAERGRGDQRGRVEQGMTQPWQADQGAGDAPWGEQHRDDPTRVAIGAPGGPGGQPPRDGAGEGGGRRLRRPHRRRAEAGQETGLTSGMQSDLPSWLQERGEGVAPARRLLSLSVAGFSGLLGLALILGAYMVPGSYAFVVLAVQVLFVLAWTVTIRPAGPRIVAGVALAAAAGSDLAASLPQHASLAPLGLIMVAAVGAAVGGQLLRRSPRPRVTESLGSTLIVVIGVICFAMLIVLSRHAPGTPAIVACLVAAGVALVVARLTDTVLPSPRTSPQVPRGSIGVVLGAMAGTVAASIMGSVLSGLHPPRAAIVGLATALVAVLADLAVSYAEVSRELDGGQPALWIARHLQGPLGGFALASPVAYVLSVMVLVTNLN